MESTFGVLLETGKGSLLNNDRMIFEQLEEAHVDVKTAPASL